MCPCVCPGPVYLSASLCVDSRRKDAEHTLLRSRGDYKHMEKLRYGYTTVVSKQRTLNHAAGVDITTNHNVSPKKKQVRCAPCVWLPHVC